MTPTEAILETIADTHPTLSDEELTAEAGKLVEGLWDRGIILASARRRVLTGVLGPLVTLAILAGVLVADIDIGAITCC